MAFRISLFTLTVANGNLILKMKSFLRLGNVRASSIFRQTEKRKTGGVRIGAFIIIVVVVGGIVFPSLYGFRASVLGGLSDFMMRICNPKRVKTKNLKWQEPL
ncbi:MAG: hypothetical protein FWH21_07920 [Kiritimatiellaeota bacterium]|nr:hypothetical protein [Kiritimatiellota bacterium]